jgi:hypothetical protein
MYCICKQFLKFDKCGISVTEMRKYQSRTRQIISGMIPSIFEDAVCYEPSHFKIRTLQYNFLLKYYTYSDDLEYFIDGQALRCIISSRTLSIPTLSLQS